MRLVVAFFTFLLYNGVIAASAYWSGIYVIDDGIYNDDTAQYFLSGNVRNKDGNRAEINSTFYGHKENGALYLKHDDFSLEQNEPTFNWWAFAVYGDIVSDATFSSLNHIEDFYGNDWYTGGTLVENPDDFYMAFKVSEVIWDGSDYVAGETWYGWVHASIDDKLEMSLLGDGINLTGGAVTVGASPEPASGLLLLVGGALLALRRRRRALMPCRSDRRRQASSRC